MYGRNKSDERGLEESDGVVFDTVFFAFIVHTWYVTYGSMEEEHCEPKRPKNIIDSIRFHCEQASKA